MKEEITLAKSEKNSAESLTKTIEAFSPAIFQILENQSKAYENQGKVSAMQAENYKLHTEKQFELADKNLTFAASRFNKTLAFIAGITMFLAAVIMIMVYRGEYQLALSVISYIGAIVAGIIGGAGWQKLREDNKN